MSVELISIIIITLVILVLPITQVQGGKEVNWKIFKEKNMFLPSNILQIGHLQNMSKIHLHQSINMYFYYQDRSSLAELALYAQQSLFTNSSELVDSYPVYLQNEPNYEVLKTTQCGKYVIKNTTACDTIVTYKDTRLENEPVVKHLIIGTIDENCTEYIIEYFVTENLYEHFLPVAEETIKSFNVTGNTEFSEGKSSLT